MATLRGARRVVAQAARTYIHIVLLAIFNYCEYMSVLH